MQFCNKMEQFYLMNTDDEGRVVKLNHKTCIYRYMGIEGLLCMLGSSGFYVKQKSSYPDVDESRMLPLKESFAFTALNTPNYDTSIVQNEINKKQELFKKESHLLTSCWSKGPSENYLLWKCYTVEKYGVCIKSTIGHFVESIIDDSFTVWCGKVIYRYRNQTDHYDEAKWIKSPEYKGEDEIRFYFVPKEEDKMLDDSRKGTLLKCDTETMIDKILLSPFLTIDEYYKIADSISQTYRINRKKIEKSKIEIKKDCYQ